MLMVLKQYQMDAATKASMTVRNIRGFYDGWKIIPLDRDKASSIHTPCIHWGEMRVPFPSYKTENLHQISASI